MNQKGRSDEDESSNDNLVKTIIFAIPTFPPCAGTTDQKFLREHLKVTLNLKRNVTVRKGDIQ